MQERINSVQRSNKPDILIGQESKKLTDSRSNASLTIQQLKKNCKKHCFLVVGLEKVVFRGGNC